MNAQDVIDAILWRYQKSPGEWFIFRELSIYCPVTKRKRRIDLYCLRMRGSDLETHAIEVKVDRADFKAETLDPSKSKPFRDQSSLFYVATPHDLIEVNELPPGWGWIETWPKGSSRVSVAPVINRKAEASSALLRRIIYRLVDVEAMKYQAPPEGELNSYLAKEPV